MPTAFQGIPKTILHRVGPRLDEPSFRWAPSTLLHKEPLNYMLQSRVQRKKTDTTTSNSSPTSLVTEKMDRGIPTSRGLLVRFLGYSFSMARCPAGIPNNPWNVRQQEGGTNLRGVDATWYMIDHRLPAERDDLLSTKSLREIIEEEGGNLWVTHVESAFSKPQLVAQAKGGQQVTDTLLVSLVSNKNNIKYVQS